MYVGNENAHAGKLALKYIFKTWKESWPQCKGLKVYDILRKSAKYGILWKLFFFKLQIQSFIYLAQSPTASIKNCDGRGLISSTGLYLVLRTSQSLHLKSRRWIWGEIEGKLVLTLRQLTLSWACFSTTGWCGCMRLHSDDISNMRLKALVFTVCGDALKPKSFRRRLTWSKFCFIFTYPLFLSHLYLLDLNFRAKE